MPTYSLRIVPADIVRLVRAEIHATGGQPEFYVDARQDYVIEEDYDRAAYGLHDGEAYDLVTAEAALNIEPRVEQNYWILSVIVHRELGPQVIEDENALLGAPLTLDAFETAFLADGKASVRVRLTTHTREAKRHFDRWWAELSERHRRDLPGAGRASAAPGPGERRLPMADAPPSANTWTYRAREAVGVFADPDALEAAVNQLEGSGLDRASISVLGVDAKAKARVGDFYRAAADIEDDGRMPRAAFVSKGSKGEGKAAAVVVPLYIGGLAGAAAVAASGGALAAAIAATILGGAAGAGLGALLLIAVSQHHARRVEEQLAKGGMVLWVGVRDDAEEQRALAILTQAGGRDVHAHAIQRAWGPSDRPLSVARVDPFLHRDPPV